MNGRDEEEGYNIAVVKQGTGGTCGRAAGDLSDRDFSLFASMRQFMEIHNDSCSEYSLEMWPVRLFSGPPCWEADSDQTSPYGLAEGKPVPDYEFN